MKMFKRMVVMLLLVGGLFGGLYLYQQFVAEMLRGFLAANANPPATVTAMVVEPQPWQPQIRAVGTLRAVQGVELRSEVSGIVEAIHFRSGDRVSQGDLLLELNSAEEQAQLQALQASRQLAEINLQRDRQQFKINAISQARLDAAESELKSRLAQEGRQQVIIRKKQIRAPFSGRLGISKIDVGQLLNPGEVVVSLQNIERLYVDFSLPQQELGALHRGQRFTLSANIDETQVVDGEVHAIHTEVSRTTRNIQVEGVIENRNQQWMPGMFVHLKVNRGGTQQLLTLPQTAISYNAYGPTLFLVKEAAAGAVHPTAQQVFVETGMKRGDQVAILSGVTAGQQVVTSGQMKLKNGTPLIIDNTIQPANEAEPTPQEK
jgi:membrane fusion protein (multidrug efflux system)